MMMNPMERVLSLWRGGFIDSDAVVDWADAEIRAEDQPAMEIMELSLRGPARYLKELQPGTPMQIDELDFLIEFSLRALACDLSSEPACSAFAAWLSRRVILLDQTSPEAGLGYQLDHLLCDCLDPAAALALLRQQLPGFLPQCRERVLQFLAPLPRLPLDRLSLGQPATR